MIEITFEQAFTFENIYKAHLQGRKCKRDKKPLVKFEMNMLDRVCELYDKLNRGTYTIGKYNTFTVEEPKRREIQTLHYSARVVQHVLCDEVLMPYFTRRAILDNCVCQKGKGTHFALDRFENMLHAFVRKHGTNGYFLKCDVLKYFPSIPHDKLAEIFLAHIRDERLKDLLLKIIDSSHTAPEYLEKYGIPYGLDARGLTCRGVPIGNQTSQLFGMFYLNSVDRLVKEKLRVKVYTRYMDDFILLHEDKQFLKDALTEIERAVAALGLKLNGKTQLFPMKNGVTYLGFRFDVLPTGRIVKTVKKRTKRRLRWRARLLKKAYLDGIVDGERVRTSLAAFHGHLSHGNCYRLEKELSEKLREYAFKNTIVKLRRKNGRKRTDAD